MATITTTKYICDVCKKVVNNRKEDLTRVCIPCYCKHDGYVNQISFCSSEIEMCETCEKN